jgi:hypothetical protein
MRLKLRGAAHSNPTGESQCESIAGHRLVAKSPTAAALLILSVSQPETSPLSSPDRLRRMVLQRSLAILFLILYNLLFLCHLPPLVLLLFDCYCSSPPWHPTCLLYCGEASHPTRSSVDEN